MIKNNNHFVQHLQKSSKLVEQWPRWKREALFREVASHDLGGVEETRHSLETPKVAAKAKAKGL